MNYLSLKYIFVAAFLGFLYNLKAQEKYTVKRLPFNTEEAREYAPALYKNGIVFCSNREHNSLVTFLDLQSKKPTTDLYFVPADSGWAKEPELFSRKLKTHYHEGPVAFSADESTVFLTRNVLTGKRFGDDLGRNIKQGIFWSKQREPGEWGRVHIFSYNSQKYDIGHPSVSKDGEMLFFSSNMEGSYGGYDLYVSYWKSGRWTEPQNLGPVINTKADEMFPFFHQNGRLYFSSNRPGGLGGMDIYFTSKKDSIWTSPNRMTAPVNSSYHDYSLVVNDPHNKGYFASNRSGSDDIYSFEVSYPAFEKCDSVQERYLCYDFFEETTAGIDTLPLIYEWDFGDGTKERALQAQHCFPGAGSYTIKLNIIDTLLGQVYKNEATYELEIPEIDLGIDSEDTLVAGKPVPFLADDKNWQAFEIDDWYWQFDNGLLRQGREQHYVFDRPGHYRVQLGITGHKQKATISSKKCIYKEVVVIGRKK